LKQKRKKVLILAQSFIRYKKDITSAFLFVLAKKIIFLGYDVEVVGPHEKGLPFYERVEDVPIYRFRYGLDRHETLAYRGSMHQLVKKSFFNKLIFIFFLLSFFWKALKLAQKPETKLIHAHWWIPSGLIGAMVSLVSGKPLLVTTHGTDIMVLKTSGPLRILASFVFNRAAHITVVSNFLKKRLTSVIPIPSTKITVRPMPVNIEQFSPSEKKRTERRKTILCVARYTKQKRLNTLIEAVSLLKEEGLDFKAILIGEGEEEENLRKMIQTQDLSEEITLLPLMSQQELSRYYRESDVVVLPSVDEGFGLVLVEAQLCHTPVIGTDSGGILDIIEHEKTGLLFPPGEAHSLAYSIKHILTDEELARNLTLNAYQKARSRFSPENVAQEFIKIYDGLIK
jgi:glycosyltransferase involved in cell wall biosynthesis